MKDAQFELSPPLVSGGVNDHKPQAKALHGFVN